MRRITGGVGKWFYYHYDGLGSVVAISDSSGKVVEKYSYDVFGTPTIRDANDDIRTTSAYGNSRMFTGREFDNETGLYYYRARYYHPRIGRFMSADPIGALLQVKFKQRPEKEAYNETYSLVFFLLEKIMHYGLTSKFSPADPVATFLQEGTTISGKGLNLYICVDNNPVNWIDPLGLFSLKACHRCAQTFLPRWTSEPDNHTRHCNISCEISQWCPGGAFCGLAAGWGHEFADLVERHGWISPADVRANYVGIDCSGRRAGCRKCCEKHHPGRSCR